MPSAFYWPLLVPCALRAPAPVNSFVRPHIGAGSFHSHAGFQTQPEASSILRYLAPTVGLILIDHP